MREFGITSDQQFRNVADLTSDNFPLLKRIVETYETNKSLHEKTNLILNNYQNQNHGNH
jgi:hypothetical protein